MASNQRATTGANLTPPATPDTDLLHRQHGNWLVALLRRRFGRHDAEDLAQETYLRIVDQRSCEPVQNSRGLMRTVASNLAKDTFRRERVRADHARAADAARSEGAGNWTAEDDLQVREAVLALPPKLRDVLLLSKIGGLTNREIAQR